jgi:hypothetical protein
MSETSESTEESGWGSEIKVGKKKSKKAKKVGQKEIKIIFVPSGICSSEWVWVLRKFQSAWKTLNMKTCPPCKNI